MDPKWIPLLLDPALVGSVATTSDSSEIGVVGRERESEKGTVRGLVAAPTTVCRWGNVAGAATGVQTAWARRGKREREWRSTGEGGRGWNQYSAVSAPGSTRMNTRTNTSADEGSSSDFARGDAPFRVPFSPFSLRASSNLSSLSLSLSTLFRHCMSSPRPARYSWLSYQSRTSTCEMPSKVGLAAGQSRSSEPFAVVWG